MDPSITGVDALRADRITSNCQLVDAVHHATQAAWRDNQEDNGAFTRRSTIAEHVTNVTINSDAIALHALAYELGKKAEYTDDPRHTLHNLGRATGSIAAAASSVIRTALLRQDPIALDGVDGDEAVTEYGNLIQHLVKAAEALDKIAHGWFR